MEFNSSGSEAEMESTNDKFLKILSKLQNELSSGLLYTHTRINDNTKKTFEAASFLYALIRTAQRKRFDRN